MENINYDSLFIGIDNLKLMEEISSFILETDIKTLTVYAEWYKIK